MSSAHDWLAVTLRHEVGDLLLHGIHTPRAAALSQPMLPHVLGVGEMAGVAVVPGWVEAAVGRGLRISAAVLGSSLGEPLVVAGVARRGRHRVVGSAIARVRRCEGSTPGVVGPASLARAVGLLLGLHSLVPLILGNLLLEVTRVGGGTVTAVSGQFGVDGRDQRSESLAADLGSLSLLHILPFAPVVEPSLVVLAKVEVDIEAPAHGLNPVELQSVELGNSDAADLGPGAVLEGVVVEELAAEEKRNGKVSPNLTLGGLVRALTLHGVDSLSEVVHSQENGGAWKSRRGEDLRDEFAKGRGNRGIRGHNARRHLGHVLGHHVDLIIEDGTYASGHDEGVWGGPTKIEQRPLSGRDWRRKTRTRLWREATAK